MEKKKTLKDYLPKILWGIAFTVIIFGVICILMARKYISENIHFEPKYPQITVGQTVTIEDLVDIQSKGRYTASMMIELSQIEDAAVSEDGKSLFVGTSVGGIRIMITGRGSNSETVTQELILNITDK